jgi:hypothetical protein
MIGQEMNRKDPKMTAGYSERPLAAKLGLKPGLRTLIIDAPDGFPTLLDEAYETLIFDGASHQLDYIHWFVVDHTEYVQRFPEVKAKLAPTGMLWASWPKKSANVATDITETTVRDIALANGLVDVKVCAIDAVWSGLKLVYRIKDR